MKSRRECTYTRELDLETLVWTRGPNFPLSSLDGASADVPALPVAASGGDVSAAVSIEVRCRLRTRAAAELGMNCNSVVTLRDEHVGALA